MIRYVFIAALTLVLSAGMAQAEVGGVLRIGVLNDMSSVYSDYQGRGSVVAAQMAIEDYAKMSSRKTEVLGADHQNKPDVGAAIARRWLETEGVDVIVDLPNSAVAFAVSEIVRDQNKVMIGSGAGSALLTGARCSPNTVHWTYDTWAYGHAMARAVIAQGGKTWFFITADYAFGHDLEKQAADEVTASGGRILGAVRHPIGASDFASYLVQAQSSGAEIVAFANAGGDLSNSLKQAAEFGLGIEAEGSRPDLRRHQHSGARPESHAGHPVGRAVLLGHERGHARLLETFPGAPPQQDDAERHACRRVCERDALSEGGRQSRLAERRQGGRCSHEGDADRRPPVRQGNHPRGWPQGAPDVSAGGEKAGGIEGDWDYMKVVGTIEAERAFRPLNEGGCPLIAK